MNLSQHPDTLDRLASHYALGTMRGAARRRFETMARQEPLIRAAALAWQTRLAGMTELQREVAPEPQVWTRLNNLVQADLQASQMRALRNTTPPTPQAAANNGASGWWRNLTLWRSAALAGVLATNVVWITSSNLRQQLGEQLASAGAQLTNAGQQLAQLRTQLQAQPQLAYVAVLSDDKSSASMLVTFDPAKRTLSLQRVGGFQEGADKSLQLWALPPTGGPRSLGVLGQERIVRFTAAEGDITTAPTLAISLEPRGGVPGSGGPTGPVLFKGALIQNAL